MYGRASRSDVYGTRRAPGPGISQTFLLQLIMLRSIKVTTLQRRSVAKLQTWPVGDKLLVELFLVYSWAWFFSKLNKELKKKKTGVVW